MDRGAWQATVHVVARVARDLATKPKRYNLLVQIMRTLYINFIGRLRCNLAPKLRNNEMEVEVELSSINVYILLLMNSQRFGASIKNSF